jgi:hypothetical protein
MTTKMKILGQLLFFILLLFSIKLEAVGYINSLYAPLETKYLGAGFNSLSKNYIYDNSCLSFSSTETQTLGGVSNTTYYCFVNSKKELAEKFLYNFSTNVGMTTDTTAESRVTDIILNNTVFSANKITLIAYWKEEDEKIFSNDLPTLSNEAISILHSNSKKFFQLYGDKYVSSVTLGKIFFIVYQADISAYSSYSTRTKSAIKRAMELNLKKILGVKLTATEMGFINDKLADISICSSTFGNDLDDVVGPYSADDFKDILKKISLSKSTVISSELKDYSYTDNPDKDAFYNISEYLNMAEIWNKSLSNLNYIESNPRLDADLISDCRTAIDSINAQIKLVCSLDPEARVPSSKETLFLNSLYTNYITEMQIAPRTYITPPIEKQLDLDLSNLNDVESIQVDCEITKKKGGFGGGFGSSKPVKIMLYVIDEDGNWSVVNSVPMSKTSTVTLYEGIKFCDKFRIGFDGPKINTGDMKIIVSYLEKVDDIIWLLVHDKK